MQLTPSQSFEHIKESLVQYLETAYKIAHPSVHAERAKLLRDRSTVAQTPFIEATPAFQPGRKLAELERARPDILPAGLAELVQHGVPVDRFPLYKHQEEALLAAFGEKRNLLVATGTGSGKTETFLLPILADILREAQAWPSVNGVAKRGAYNAQANAWLHSRRHERRPAAMRAIILYPMNALVNDQLTRLRRILARGTSPDWQRRNLNGNVIHFGMYTSITQPTGSWTEKWRRDKFDAYMQGLEADWQKLREDLRDNGGWPRPDSPEMLCRWDVQAAPPDIVVTNYSMLEYMLVRPIEYPIFESTKRWLAENEDARLTLVLDEAHTYTGAKGTEVAHLVARLKERLGLQADSPKFRGIATSASIPNVAGAEGQLLGFMSELFAEPADTFTLVQITQAAAAARERRPDRRTFDAFATFQDRFAVHDPWPAIEQLAEDLDLGRPDRSLDPQVALHQMLEGHEDIEWVRQRTARKATPLNVLADEYWPGTGTTEERERATAGVLAAGSFARAEALPDTPPLLSMRVHGFFRGITGLWACMDPECSAVDAEFMTEDGSRPVGKVYTDARPWCECGARVLEMFSCRHCGLLFLGGIPDRLQNSLWPWSDDLTGGKANVDDFRVFGVEKPHPDFQAEYRSVWTTLPVHPNELHARSVYEMAPTIDTTAEGENEISPFPQQCPRCQNWRAPGEDGREVIEPLRTKGPQSFSAVVEDAFRNQPRAAKGNPPNYGRKALLFSDSRQEAAKLAADLRRNHDFDVFRQVLYRVLHGCASCLGDGVVKEVVGYSAEGVQEDWVPCLDCQGTGKASEVAPLNFDELRRRAIELQMNHGINPTNGRVADFFTRYDAGDDVVYEWAQLAFHLAMRRELAEDEFALEPLGLASWKVRLPATVEPLPELTPDETRVFLRSVARILATEQILLPPPPAKPWEWPKELVKQHERRVLSAAQGRTDNKVVRYNVKPYRKLGRYVIAVSRALQAKGRLSSRAAAEKWVADLHWPLWSTLVFKAKVLRIAGKKEGNHIPHGLGLEVFELHPLGDCVCRCTACAYVMSETLLDVCIRCGQKTEPVPKEKLKNYYCSAASYALPGSLFDDPYPLRASEHTAQIGSEEARNEERWFQDLFHDDQNRHDHRVDVLSVTTTMEMGIDIGSLLCVGLRNVPPTVANYQQRAGRAGRRGSSIATVLTYSWPRNHDQYYFERPKEIVSEPPRVPSLYLNNEVFARRHVRSLVLQDFFYSLHKGQGGSGLFTTWGTIQEFGTNQTAQKLQQYLATNRAMLVARCKRIVHPQFTGKLREWIDAICAEVQAVVNEREPKQPLFEEMINSGQLPKYAFPVDVVALNIPVYKEHMQEYQGSESNANDAMQRDLSIALSEYAPGAEILRGEFPKTYKYRSVGVYDPFERDPDYSPTGKLVECSDCQAVKLIGVEEVPPLQCEECGSFNVETINYLRPRGFTVDAALPDGGREEYEGDGRERSGYTVPARLMVGQTSFDQGKQRASNLYSLQRVGDLFTCNKGKDDNYPGFLICPDCGRSLDLDDPGPHTRPSNVPPNDGWQKGPRAGEPCPNRTNFENQVILGHRFHSEVVLLGVDLPDSMDAPFNQPSGRALWYSFAMLLANGATRALQIDPGELKIGARPVMRKPGRVHGEVFLYDDVAGGAGYARAVDANLNEVLTKALELGRDCRNPSCGGACYECMLDYRNQTLHPLLDRGLGTSLLEFVLEGKGRALTAGDAAAAAKALEQFAKADYEIQEGFEAGKHKFPYVLRNLQSGDRTAVWTIHPLQARPTAAERQMILGEYGVRCSVHTSFDLLRRPFWVLNNLGM